MNYEHNKGYTFLEGNYYSNHVVAMTRESLHSKSDIADELAVRDAQIDYLCKALSLFKGTTVNKIKKELPQYLLGED